MAAFRPATPIEAPQPIEQVETTPEALQGPEADESAKIQSTQISVGVTSPPLSAAPTSGISSGETALAMKVRIKVPKKKAPWHSPKKISKNKDKDTRVHIRIGSVPVPTASTVTISPTVSTVSISLPQA
jgi:hypothetical protein